MVLYFVGVFFLIFLLSEFILSSVWLFWLLLPLLRFPWNCQVWKLVLLPIQLMCFSPSFIFGQNLLGSLLQNKNKIRNTTFLLY